MFVNLSRTKYYYIYVDIVNVFLVNAKIIRYKHGFGMTLYYIVLYNILKLNIYYYGRTRIITLLNDGNNYYYSLLLDCVMALC